MHNAQCTCIYVHMQDFFEFLNDLQTKLTKTIKSVGRIDHR